MKNGRCRMHGGKSLFGCVSPSFRHGQYSKSVVQRIIGRESDAFQEAIHVRPETLRRIEGRIIGEMRLYRIEGRLFAHSRRMVL